MLKRILLPTIAFSLAIAGASLAGGQSDEFHPVTGEPKCTNCHAPDKRYSIDYSRDETCVGCHGPALSDKYLDIDSKFKDEHVTKLAKADPAKEQKPKAKTASSSDMVLVPAGEFTMGSNDWWPKSQPEHKRKLDAFYIDRYEVTNRDYMAYVKATGAQMPSHWTNGKIPANKETHPVVYVTWYDAENYCKWRGKRLVREAEWEKAARGIDKRAFPWGDKFDKQKGNTPQLGMEDTMPVGSFESGKSPYGVYDMAGNAWEWVDDWFKPYPGNTHPDENYGEMHKVLKGGSWYDCTYYKCGISAPTYNRIFFNPATRNNNFGFRCAKDK